MPKRSRTPKRIVLWDIDDTLVITKSECKLTQIGEVNMNVEWCNLAGAYLDEILDDKFKYGNTDKFDVVNNIMAWDGSENKEVREYATFLRDTYHAEAASPTCLMLAGDMLKKGWDDTLEQMELRNYRWTDTCRKTLAQLQDIDCKNIIVTASELVPAIAKLILWGYVSFFDIEDVYSSADVKNKSSLFLQIIQKEGGERYKVSHEADLEIFACGDGADEEDAARSFGIPFVKIDAAKDIPLVVTMVSGSDDNNSSSMNTARVRNCTEDPNEDNPIHASVGDSTVLDSREENTTKTPMDPMVTSSASILTAIEEGEILYQCSLPLKCSRHDRILQ